MITRNALYFHAHAERSTSIFYRQSFCPKYCPKYGAKGEMMIPTNRAEIITNLQADELERAIDALENKRDEIEWGEGSLYAGAGRQEFEWQGQRYEFHEYYEKVTNINKLNLTN
jgi:hypothetical protein